MARRLVHVTVVLLACTAVTVAAANGAQRGRKPATHTITITGMQFTPATLTIKPGDTVVWVNKDILAHTATAKAGAFDSKILQPGQSWKFVAKQKGSFAYTCIFHPMNGTLTVR